MACILVVDDSPDIRLVMARLLHSRGHEADVAASGPEALQKVAQGSFDLVLLDLTMPGMDGLSVLEALRGEDGRPRVPVMIMSALSGEEQFAAARRLGACDYLVKSRVDVEELDKRLRSCLGARVEVQG